MPLTTEMLAMQLLEKPPFLPTFTNILLKIAGVISCRHLQLLEKSKNSQWSVLVNIVAGNLIEPVEITDQGTTMLNDVLVQKSGLLELDKDVGHAELFTFFNHYFQDEITSIAFMAVEHDDGSAWVLFFAENKLTHSLQFNLLSETLIIKTVLSQLQHLKTIAVANYHLVQQGTLSHEQRNLAQTVEGGLLLILDYSKELIKKICTISDESIESDELVEDRKKQLLFIVHQIVSTTKSLAEDMNVDKNGLQSYLDSIAPYLKQTNSPEIIKKMGEVNLTGESIFNLKKVIILLIKQMKKIASQKSKSIEVTIDNNLEGIYCRGYADKLKAILRNLINNAIEHGVFKDKIKIFLTVSFNEERNQININIKVSNRIGSPLKLPLPKNSGTGIGQPVIQRDLGFFKHASITKDKTHDNYSVDLSLQLPIVEKVKPLVLVVEDHLASILILMNKLKKEYHCRVHVAKSVAQALALLGTNQYKIIFIDGMLEDKSLGEDLAAAIRKTDHIIPLVWISGSELNENQIKSNYFNESLTKPFKFDVLKLIMNKYIFQISPTMTMPIKEDVDEVSVMNLSPQ